MYMRNYPPQLAFIDLETTGFSPKKGDRIVEVAIINTDWEGNILDRFDTLINPLREVSGTEIHGLTAEMLKEAPSFSDAMDDVLFFLKDKLVVGHNLSFDLRFLEAEIERHYRHRVHFEGLCTLQLSKTLFPNLPIRRLDALCEFLDVELVSSHSALGDCEATMELFNRMKKVTDHIPNFDWKHVLARPFYIDISLAPKGQVVNRETAQDRIHLKKSQFREFINRLPADPKSDVSTLQYLNLLDEVLVDRKLTSSEVESLMDMIQLMGLGKSQVIAIHEDYLRNLCRVYWKDHVLSESEKSDLLDVSNLLGIDQNSLQRILDEELQKVKNEGLNQDQQSFSVLIQGKTICFTGALHSTLNGNPIDRGFAQRLAIENGMIIKSGVSKGLDYLVSADPNSLSGKSLKAREYGVKVIAEPVFWSWMNFKVD